MRDQLKQRVVGGIVIVCVMAIFLPVLLHRPKTKTFQQVPMAIPKPTEVSQMSLQPSRLSEHASSNTINTIVNITTSSTPSAKIAATEQAVVNQVHTAVHSKLAPIEDHSVNSKILQSAFSTPKAWVVQLGSFSMTSHANRLVVKLRQQGFSAYQRTSHTQQGVITRVFVGPQISKRKMEQINHQLTHKFHLKGVVRKYHV